MIQRTDQIEILHAITERLISSIDLLNDSNCWLSDQAVPGSMPAGRFAVTVSVGAGRFPHEYFDGGGVDTLTEDGAIVITPIVSSPADRPKRAWKTIGGRAQRGDAPTLIQLKQLILKAMLSEDWEPTNESGDAILRDMISPLDSSAPADVRVGETVAIAMQIRFSTAFDWSLE
ncbi:hypothetical protein [Roseiconus lacunae]|uniref:hypothetical protein n=1 Tax=Roseiconus lacunae TaxID=2605694 RepID=UPI001E35CFF4|nr:hypothetical protein [Roseiconus lacunae]MCD0459102.1 hypothetical protein [Roseiconus lacunae]